MAAPAAGSSTSLRHSSSSSTRTPPRATTATTVGRTALDSTPSNTPRRSTREITAQPADSSRSLFIAASILSVILLVSTICAFIFAWPSSGIILGFITLISSMTACQLRLSKDASTPHSDINMIEPPEGKD